MKKGNFSSRIVDVLGYSNDTIDTINAIDTICAIETEQKIEKFAQSDIKYLKLIFKNQKTKVFRIYTKDKKYIGKICENNENISREALCGTMCTNNLKSYVPNFPRTFFLVHFPKPEKIKNIIKTRWKIPESQINIVPFLIIENVQTYSSLKKILSKCDTKLFLDIIIQIVNALNVAYILYDFTHYDLHLGNILLVKEKNQIKIYEDLENYKVFEFNYLVKIIDYEHSHFYVKGVHYGHDGLKNYKIKKDESYPVHDIYKLFMTCSSEIIKSHNDKIKYSLLKKIYKIFELGKSGYDGIYNIELDFSEIREKYIYFQPPNRIKNITYLDFLKYIIEIKKDF